MLFSSPAASYLGNQLLSYGQNLSFSLRLDRGVRHPSADDVILEGGGQRVSASLGGLHSIIPSGKKINFSFRSADDHVTVIINSACLGLHPYYNSFYLVCLCFPLMMGGGNTGTNKQQHTLTGNAMRLFLHVTSG